ncbi:MAG: DUF5678 domain-containing protein [Chloroflexota bacterium]|nr:DUF5678 domain-containing protein [Chloroflexota bacterium]
MGISTKALRTIKPLAARLTPAEQLDLIHWLVNEKTNQPAEETPQDNWQTRISAEAQSWYNRPTEERQPYLGQHVAVLAGRVIDHDPNRVALYQRVQKKYPDTPVLITTAEARRPRELLILSPRLERD